MKKTFGIVLFLLLSASLVNATEYIINNTGVWPGFINPRTVVTDEGRGLVFCGTGDLIGIYDSDMTYRGNFRVTTKTGIRGMSYDNELKILHIAAGIGGYIAVDVSDIQNLKILSSITENTGNPGYVMGSKVNEIDAYAVKFATGKSIQAEGDSSTPTVRRLVYLADYNFGMRVYDVTEPSAIFETGSYRQDSPYETNTTGGYINVESLTFDGKLYVFIIDRYYGLRVFDATNPKNILKPVSKDLRDFYYNSISLIRDLSPGIYKNAQNSDELYCFVTGPNTSSTQAAVVKYKIVMEEDPTDTETTAIKEIKNIGRCDTLAMGRGMDLQGNYAYIADNNKGVRIVDIINPVSTTQSGLENYAIKSSISNDISGAYSVFVSGSSLFMSDYRRGLRTYDVSNPEFPVDPGLSSQNLMNGTALDIADFYVDKNRTFSFMVSGGNAPALYIHDVSTEDSIKLVAVKPLPSEAYGVRVFNDFVYIAAGDDGLYILNVFDPRYPGDLIHLDTPGFAYDVAVKDGYVFIADGESGLSVIDARDPLNPSEVKNFPTSGKKYRAVEIKGNYAYIASWNKGLSVCDITNPLSPVVDVASMDTPGESQGIHLSGNYAYIADGASGLQVINITDPLHPGQPLQTSINGIAKDVSVVGNYAFITRGESGYSVVNLEKIQYSSVVPTYSTLGDASGIKIYRDGIFVADGPGLLNVSRFSVKDETPPPPLNTSDPESACFVRSSFSETSKFLKKLKMMCWIK